MKTAIRFHTRFGHTAQMANVIADVTHATPETVAVPITEPVDTLYLGAGVLLGKVDGSIRDFIRNLSPDLVGRVICFGSSAIIPSPVPQMRQMLQAQGIVVAEESFTCRGSMGPLHAGHPNKQDLEDLRQFVLSTL